MRLSDIKNPKGKQYRRKGWPGKAVAILKKKKWMFLCGNGYRAPLIARNKEADDWYECKKAERLEY